MPAISPLTNATKMVNNITKTVIHMLTAFIIQIFLRIQFLFFNEYLSFFDMQRKNVFLIPPKKTIKIYRKTINPMPATLTKHCMRM